jgi:hypothetical protein
MGKEMNWCILDAQTPQEEVRPYRVEIFIFIQGLHQVRNRKAFFHNLANIMKPESKLVLCDFFFNETGLDEQEVGWGLRVTKKKDITANVLAAIERADYSAEEAEINKHLSYLVKDWAREQFGLPGSWIHKKMTKRNGKTKLSYWAYEIEMITQSELKLD